MFERTHGSVDGGEEDGGTRADIVDFLLSAEARQALIHLRGEDLGETQLLSILAELRRQFRPEQAGGLLRLARLRQRALAKFAAADSLYFTEEALEQATAEEVARHRARWLHHHAPPGPVLDLGCGIGGDTLALAQHRHVIAYDISATRLRFARANAEALGLAERVTFHRADWTVALARGALPAAAAAFADPARRVDGRRVFSLNQMQPPLADLLALQARIPALGVKVAPGVNDAEIPQACGVEFISHERTCKEGVLWFGPLRGEASSRWASVHDGARWHRLDSSLAPPPVGDLLPGYVLHEPDPAVIRAGAFAELCQLLDAHLFDPQLAYLVGTKEASGTAAEPFVQSFRVEAILPSSLKQLNRRLQSLEVGQVELKKRGVPFEPESLRPRLKLTPGGRDAVVIFTRRGDERITILGHRIR